MYILGGINLEQDFGIIPVEQSDSNIALLGCFDMPARIGKTHHDWADANGIEPYVRADEIRLAGRDIFFFALMEAEYENDVLRKLYDLYDTIGGIGTLMTFETTFGNFEVYLKEEIQAEYIHQGWAKLRFAFREPIVPNTGTIPTADNKVYGIDNISFQALGLTVLDVEGRHYLPATKAMSFTAYEHEGYQITKRNAREITLKCIVEGSSLNDFETKLKNLFKLLSSEGLRTITYRSDALRTFFCKDGFQVSGVMNVTGSCWGLLSVKCVQVSSDLDWNFLTNSSGVAILTNTGQKIILN